MRVLALLLALVAALAAALANGPLAQADRLSDARAEADQVQADLEELDMRLSAAVEEFNQAEQALADTEDSIAQNERRLVFARGNLSTAQAELSSALVAAYRNGQSDVIEALLGAQSLDQMLNELTMAKRVSSHTRDVLDRVRRYQSEVKDRAAALEKQRTARKQAVASRAEKQREIEGMLADRRSRLASVKGEIRQIIREREAAARRAAAARAAAAADRLRQAAADDGADDPDIGGSVDDTGDGGGSGGGDDGGVEPPPASSIGAGAASVALSQLGVPYVWAGASPSGFDCSGLVVWAFAQAGMGGLPHSTYSLWGMGSPVSRDQLEPGDLVFFYGLGHMGIYIGGGQFVHAPHTGDVVKVSDIDGYPSYDGARRL